jgi:arylsulfatase A-like enzyme
MNVLLLVLDCLREDAVTEETAPNIHSLAEDNLSFENCVTPANWSLPAHASLFTGLWPHEHNYFHREHQLDDLPLVNSFNDREYTTVGVSSNLYASSSHGFATGFDRFYETRRPLNPKGLNPFANVRRLQEDREPSRDDYVQTFVDAVTHDHPIASIGNFGRTVAMELDRRYSFREHLPLGRSDKYGFLSRATKRSQQLSREAFRARSDDKDLFAFANFMDTHSPYEPPKKHFEAVADSHLDYESVADINPDISSPFTFLNEYFGDGIDEDSLELVRTAYRGEVHSVDEQVNTLLETLEDEGELEDTVVVITSDHGEALGEEDLNGERGMGHLPYLNENLWTVPLIVAHPNIESITVEDRVSLKSLTDLLMGDIDTFVANGGTNYEEYFNEDTVFFEMPANPYHEDSFDNHPNIPKWYAKREAKTHTVLGFDGDWRVIADSQGEVSAWKNQTLQESTEAPPTLVTECKNAVEKFPNVDTAGGQEVSADLERQLEDLGYR